MKERRSKDRYRKLVSRGCLVDYEAACSNQTKDSDMEESERQQWDKTNE